MATENIYKNLDGNRNELKNWSLEKLAADPTGADLYLGRQWMNITDNALRYYDGTDVQTVATLAELSKIGTFQGVHAADGGLVPSSTLDGSDIAAGDFWRVSVAGTITGIGGDDTLEVGDLIYALSDEASTAADFTAVQVNAELPAGIASTEEVTLAALPANTPTGVPTTFNNVFSVEVYDSGNEMIGLHHAGTISAPTVESSAALTNVTFRVVGN